MIENITMSGTIIKNITASAFPGTILRALTKKFLTTEMDA